MRIAIVDDREEDRAELQSMLCRYCSEQRMLMEYAAFSSAEELLTYFAPDLFELIFLDIYMAQMTGMEAARQISQLDPHCRMIFFTTSHAHAVESYEVHAAYYLTKPLDYSRLCTAMDTACADLRWSNRRIELHCTGISCVVLLRDILFVDCAAGCTVLHLAQRIITTDERVSEVFAELAQDERFLNCNRNVMVNMDHIAKIQTDCFLLKSGDIVPIRQRDRAAVKRDFLQYSLRTLRKEGGV